ncbi:hypothetical protein SDC9_106662 [bioreactor metagenome]|uniref:Uncharacterized protein n=1 Tax=bioreactor metagenome TaxID=1076179 RepID=A0A645B425_9ZZZZ
MTAIYARQSADKKDSLSIEGQIDLCKAECKGNFKIYVDKGFSGKNTKRPAFKKLMKDIGTGQIQKIVVYRLDRFSRSIVDFGQVWTFLQQHKVEFVSINEKFDTETPMGCAMLHIIMVFAQLERETIAQRIRDNYYQRAKTGGWPGGPPPFGFTLMKTVKNKFKISTLSPTDNIQWVIMMFDLYGNKDYSLGKTAKYFNEQEIPASHKRGWDNVAISRILQNPVYVKADSSIYQFYQKRGLKIPSDPKEFNGTTAAYMLGKRDKSANLYHVPSETFLYLAAHAGVIEPELFLHCQRRLAENSQLKNKGKGKNSWLSGFLKCGACGYSIKIQKTSGKNYLVCTGKANYHVCSAKHKLDIQRIESEVLHLFENELQKAKENDEKCHKSGRSTDIERVELRIDRLLRRASESDDLAASYINEEITRLEEQRNKLEGCERDNHPQPKEIRFNDLDFEDKKMLAGLFLEKVVIGMDMVELHWKI